MKLDDNKRTNSEYEEEHDKSYSSENHESEDGQNAKPRKRVRTNRMSKAGELLQMYKETETVRVAEKKLTLLLEIFDTRKEWQRVMRSLEY